MGSGSDVVYNLYKWIVVFEDTGDTFRLFWQ